MEDNADGRGTEIQIEHLPPELGGRGKSTKPRPENVDGARAARVLLPLRRS